jgi:hypothetical protein
LSMLALGATAASAADVGVSISIGQPGFFGQLDIGDFPRPNLVYSRPVIIDRGYQGYEVEPLYLHVPPGHARNWRRYCRLYGACGRQVYFVQDSWYNQVYVPRYRERHIDRDDRDYDHRDGRDYGRREDHDHDRFYDHEREERDHAREERHDYEHERDERHDHEEHNDHAHDRDEHHDRDGHHDNGRGHGDDR